ncbi:hypothetical protein ACJX0J_022829 [Zea mays]
MDKYVGEIEIYPHDIHVQYVTLIILQYLLTFNQIYSCSFDHVVIFLDADMKVAYILLTNLLMQHTFLLPLNTGNLFFAATVTSYFLFPINTLNLQVAVI